METTLQTIRWKDTGETYEVIFALCDWDELTEDDDEIFFYVSNMEELEKLKQHDNGAEFIVL